MRYLVIGLLLSGCTYNATLIQRGGGGTLTGSFAHGAKEMTIQFEGATYKGDAVQGQTAGLALYKSTAIPMMTRGNNFSVVLVGPRGTFRCEFMLVPAGGNGACIGPDERMYDLVLKP